MKNDILPITTDVLWTGILDKDLKTFDVIMTTEYGTTYNSYFINATKKTLVETVKEKYFDQYKEKLSQLCHFDELEYLIVNHTEPDHAGSIKRILEIAPQITIIASGVALRNIKNQIGIEFKQLEVKDDHIVDLGNKKLEVISAPNLHWPDTIYTYLREDKVLFTCDSFGAHFCNEKMYNDQAGDYFPAFKYYFDVILRPFSVFYLKAIEKIRHLDIQAILPGHGPLLTSNPMAVVDKTEQLCREYLQKNPIKNRVLIAFVSAYGYTTEIAEIIKEGLSENENIEIDYCDIEHISDEELSDKISWASAYLFGSPTINQNMLPNLYKIFAMMTPLRDKDKLAGCFGSYGWSGEAEKNLVSNIHNLKLKFCGETCFIKFRPHEADFERIKEYGRKFGIMMTE
ncbi:MAG: FprA family A-type flavoprotein [Bacteroidales bacterium]|jgi:flavorubredoxin|nr:FprA family A-type flavoprotein [Bacteroidales bacterium]